MEKIDIVACFNSGFVMTTGVMMYSVCVNNLEVEVTFHLVVDESVTEDDRKKLIETISVFDGKACRFYNIDSKSVTQLSKYSTHLDRVSLATYYRLCLSEILPHTLHKVLYLDGDIIVRHSLQPLWGTNLNNFAMAAVPDSLISTDTKSYERLNYPYASCYFNAGVLLINLDYWREHDAERLFIECVSKMHNKIYREDQDILNCVFYKKIYFLHIKYNLQDPFLQIWIKLHEKTDEDELREAIKDPVIVHFTGGKPWARYYNRKEPHPYSSTFYKYQQETLWKDFPVIDRRPFSLRLRHFIADLLRSLKLKAPVPSMYIELSPID